MKKVFVSVFACILFSLASNAQVVVKVIPAAPVVKIIQPAKPGHHHVWIDGHWIWDKRTKQYIWRDGYWSKPKKGHHWVPGHWVDAPGGHKWIPGHWSR
jgi:hypothetical protein